MTIYPLIEILSHQFHFQPFAYKMQVDGKLEINSQYNIGAKILVGKLIFPNQTIDLIDIVPDSKSRCLNSNSKKCSVFKFNAFLQLSGDKYFSREFANQEKIPFLFSLDFNSSNLESFKESNYIFQKSKYKYGRLSDYISNLKLIKINEHLSYKNSFYLEDTKKHASLDIPVSWTIENGKQINTYENIEVKFKHLQQRQYKTTDLFDVKTTGHIPINEHKIISKDGEEIQLNKIVEKKKQNNEWTSYYMNEKATEYLNKHSKENLGHVANNYFYNIWSKLKLILKNHGYTITIKQHLNLANQRKNIFKIIPKYDQYFYGIKKHKYIII